MAPDVPPGGSLRPARLSVTPEGNRWAVRHGGGYLGLVSSEAEAWAIVRAISGERAPEPRSFATQERWTATETTGA